MSNIQSKSIPMFGGVTMTSAATVFGTVDTLGFDFCEIDLIAGTGAAASTAVTTLQLCEDDTAPTAYADGSPVTALVGAAAVSTSAGFVLPALSSTMQNVYRFNVDLKGRKRYLGINFAPTLQTVGVSCVARLSSAADGVDCTRTPAITVAGNRLVANA